MIVNSDPNSLKLVNCTYEKVGITEQRCLTCGEFKSTTEFYVCKRVKSGFRSKCIKCTSDYNRAIEKKKKYKKIYKA